jgi:UDP-N-acetylmuramyl pentapeptide phosphotransferase/UDP-N-acetylglucosamine-1-phosphate transferase
LATAVGGFALGTTLPETRTLAPIGLGAIVIAMTAFMDDRWGVAVRWRLLTQMIVAIAFAVIGFRLDVLSLPGMDVSLMPWLAVAVSVVLIVWMTNLYNFMDGMDGFAGGMAVAGFGALAVLGAMHGRMDFAALNLIIAASAAGFLIYNFPPARIFMGDTGSTTLGFLAAVMMLWAERDGIFPLWIGVLIFSPFIVDATVTLLRRLARRERIWQAHKTHYYQRLVQLGWGHRKTVLWEYALMVACAIAAIVVMQLSAPAQWGMLGASVLTYLLLAIGIAMLETRSQRLKMG